LEPSFRAGGEPAEGSQPRKRAAERWQEFMRNDGV
jgi:hypothetical protein